MRFKKHLHIISNIQTTFLLDIRLEEKKNCIKSVKFKKFSVEKFETEKVCLHVTNWLPFTRAKAATFEK